MKTSAMLDSLTSLALALPAFCFLFLSSCSGNTLTEKPVVAFEAKATTGEGSIWHPERKSLFWVDIEGKTLYEYLPKLETCNTWTFDRMVSTVVPETDSTVVVSLQNEIVRVNLLTGANEHVASIDDVAGTVRCNDGKCDPEGRLWVGTMGFGAPKGAGKLYTVTRDGVVTVKLDSVTISNGIVWTADKRFMYYNDTPTGKVARYKFDASTGNIEFDGIAVTLAEGTGSPDGMTIDRNGNLWVAQWGGYGVYCYNPQTGELLKKVELPAPNVASCAFGGENLDILYITTARAGLSESDLAKYPQSGSLFVCKPGAVGVKASKFTK